ncbi:hypothetical protein D3C72_231300 [compost metagenome]
MIRLAPPERPLAPVQRASLGIGVLALLLCLIGAFLDPGRFFQSYLYAWLFMLGVALGSTTLLALHSLVGGIWGLLLRPWLESFGRALPLAILLGLPLAFGLPRIFPWLQGSTAAPELAHQAAYLNLPFFLARQALYILVWIGLSRWLIREAQAQDEEPHPERGYRLQKLGAAWFLVYLVTASFAAFDWVVSLEPGWNSSIFGFVWMTGELLAALATAVAAFCWLMPRTELRRVHHVHLRLNDMGNLLLTAVMTWAYVAFSQFLISWAGNLPETIVWYVRRIAGSWLLLTWFIALFQFALPFVCLLFRGIKRRPRPLGWLAALLVLTQLITTYWMVLPAFHPTGLRPHVLDVLAPLALGGLIAWEALRQLRRRDSLLPRDSRLTMEVPHGEPA